MLYALSWFLIFSFLALWSLVAWAVNAVAVWTVSNAGTLTGAAFGVDGLRLPEWVAPWVPPEIAQAMTSVLSDLAPVVEGLLQAAPALAGGLTMATWVIWALGNALLVLLAAGLHLLVAMWRRRGGGSGPQPTPGRWPHDGKAVFALSLSGPIGRALRWQGPRPKGMVLPGAMPAGRQCCARCSRPDQRPAPRRAADDPKRRTAPRWADVCSYNARS